MSEVIRIKIATKEGFSDIEAYPASNPAVVIHRASFGDDTVSDHLGFWAVTHLASGFAFANVLPNREMAEIAAEYFIAQGLDLTGDKKSIERSASSDFREKFRERKEMIVDFQDAAIRLAQSFGLTIKTEA